MGGFLLFIAFIWLIWNAFLRRIYIFFKYKDPKGIDVPDTLSKEELYTILKEKLNYPTLKTLVWNEMGELVLYCKHGQHVISLSDNKLFVGRHDTNNKKNIEEANVLDSYISKIFDINAPTNPYKEYQKLKNHSRNWFITQSILIIVAIIGFSAGAKESGLTDSFNSNNISSSYLPAYSANVTIGDVFNNFFADGKWSSHSDGAIQYVDFSGTCLFNDKNTNMIIRFWTSDTEFKVDSIYLDGTELSLLEQSAVLEKIYSDYQ